jgi:hypothetical protein
MYLGDSEELPPRCGTCPRVAKEDAEKLLGRTPDWLKNRPSQRTLVLKSGALVVSESGPWL